MIVVDFGDGVFFEIALYEWFLLPKMTGMRELCYQNLNQV